VAEGEGVSWNRSAHEGRVGGERGNQLRVLLLRGRARAVLRGDGNFLSGLWGMGMEMGTRRSPEPPPRGSLVGESAAAADAAGSRDVSRHTLSVPIGGRAAWYRAAMPQNLPTRRSPRSSPHDLCAATVPDSITTRSG